MNHTSTASETLFDLASKQQISEVVYRYCRGVDRLDWDAVRECFHADATDNHGIYSGDVDGLIAFFKKWTQQYRLAMHYVTNLQIELNGDEAVCESYCLSVLRVNPEDVKTVLGRMKFDPDPSDSATSPDGGIVEVRIGLRFADQFELRDVESGWRIKKRVVIFEWSDVSTVRTGDDIPPTMARGRRDTSDTIYSMLSELRASGSP